MLSDFNLSKLGELSFSPDLMQCIENGMSLWDEKLIEIKELD